MSAHCRHGKDFRAIEPEKIRNIRAIGFYFLYFGLLENAFNSKNPDPIRHNTDIALKTYCPEAIPL